MKKLNITIGRFQPFTQGHLNMVNEGEAPCIVYRINSSNKEIQRTKNGIKIGSKSYTNDTVNRVIEYIGNPEGDLTEQEKELLKRPFTNELINKELNIIRKSNKNIVDVVTVTHVYDALGRYNAFLTEHSDEYKVGDWMCGDDRKEAYEKNIETLPKYDELEVEFKSEKKLPNLLIGKLKINTGKGRTAGVSGTAVRKAILTKDKAAFEKIMPKGTAAIFDDLTKAFDEFKSKLKNIVKINEHRIMTLKDYIVESKMINDINIMKSLNNYINEARKSTASIYYMYNSSFDSKSLKEIDEIFNTLIKAIKESILSNETEDEDDFYYYKWDMHEKCITFKNCSSEDWNKLKAFFEKFVKTNNHFSPFFNNYESDNLTIGLFSKPFNQNDNTNTGVMLTLQKNYK